MTVIRRLDAVTIGQIAAGEVIERPVSVVKELVENALDAGAARIAVRLREGGLGEIVVVDDGGGIAAADLPLAVERHATSKLRDTAGLEAVQTLGFRGEGLASIASVARVTISSRRADEEFATTVDAFEEDVSEPRFSPGPVGTRVGARELFANVPVRREYLRSAQAETTRVSQFLTMLALGYPGVAFSLHVDEREVLNYPPARSAFDRLAHVFGRDVYTRMLEIPDLHTGMHGTIRGYISKPGLDRADRRQQILFVNGRLLKSTQLAGAWTAAYTGYAAAGRHPFGVLLIDVPPGHLDPNVHPTKSDVRFRYGAQLVDTVRRALIATLKQDARERLSESLAPSISVITHEDEASGVPEYTAAGPAAPEYALENPAVRGDVPAYRQAPLPMSPSWQNTRRLAQTPEPALAVLLEAPGESLRVLAQLDRAFILATDGRGIFIIDQHAAHERVAYEAIANAAYAAHEAGAVPRQPLLVPEIIEVRPGDAEMLEATIEALVAAGVEIEAFGDRVYRITAMPAPLASRHFDVHGYLADVDDETPGLDARERIWATMACHSVVRAGEVMQLEEMQAVIDRLARCENPMHCPHGRPTIVRFDAPAIARMFRR